MKKLLPACFLLLLLAACGGGGNKQTVKSEDGKTTTTIDAGSVTPNDADGLTRKSEELRKLTPLPDEPMKAMLPAELNGMKRKSVNITSMTGMSVGSGVYAINDTSEMEVVVTDCAGEMGSGYY